MIGIVWLLVSLSPSAAAQPPPDSQRTSPFAREFVSSHNSIRFRVSVPPLTWSDELARYAQQWAKHLLARNRFQHRPDTPYGENLYSVTGARATPAGVVESWAAEAPNYNHRKNLCRGVCGHYTQIVWRRTTKVGCGVARGRDREVWVCNYDPAGNFIGERPY